jgi:hypothetical protein
MFAFLQSEPPAWVKWLFYGIAMLGFLGLSFATIRAAAGRFVSAFRDWIAAQNRGSALARAERIAADFRDRCWAATHEQERAAFIGIQLGKMILGALMILAGLVTIVGAVVVMEVAQRPADWFVTALGAALAFAMLSVLQTVLAAFHRMVQLQNYPVANRIDLERMERLYLKSGMPPAEVAERLARMKAIAPPPLPDLGPRDRGESTRQP